MNKNILEIKNLQKRFPVKSGVLQRTKNWVHAVNDISLQIPENQTLGLVGESGSGKSTLGRLIMQLIEADSGSVSLQGNELRGLSFKEMMRHRSQMQMIFQDPMDSLNSRLTIEQIIMEPLDLIRPLRGQERRQKLYDLLDLVGLPASAINRYPHEFSGGQRQRIGIARAIALSPKLIIADEPVSALDVSIQAQVLNLMKDLQEQFQISYLFIAHDINVIRFISHQIAVMYLGSIVEKGPSHILKENPKHPYTIGLWSAVPSLDPAQAGSLQGIQGEVPSLIYLPAGCGFAPRCPHAGPKCLRERPKLMPTEKNSEHFVSCFWAIGASLE